MIKKANVYLTFSGNCGEALDFYKDVLQGEIIERMTYGEGGMAEHEKDRDLIMNSNILIGGVQFSCFDSLENEPFLGNNISFWLELDSEQSLDNILAKFKEKQIDLKVSKKETFWGSVYAKATDTFGITWELNYQR